MSARALLVVGDVLLDRDVDGRVERLSPDAPVPVVDEERTITRPGGAGLAAMLAAADGHAVTLVTALADDDAGREAAAALASGGVDVVNLGMDRPTPEKIRFRAGGRAMLRVDRGGAGSAGIGSPTAAARAAIEWADAALVSDYGRGLTAEAGVRAALAHVAARATLVWDPHPRGTAPVSGAALVTPNESEAATFAGGHGADDRLAAAARRAEALVDDWGARAVSVTRGDAGAVLATRSDPTIAMPALPVRDGDPCGAGDRFAVTATALMKAGAEAAEAVVAAVEAASAFVERGGAPGAALGHPGDSEHAGEPTTAPASGDPVAAAKARGGTVVATGGCFDLLHTGHLRTLQEARALGDCLVVCLNSDASVRRLKGPGRPLVPAADRAAMLLALECVDAVTIFDEDTPERTLERLRPDVFAKGGDYAVADLPERGALERWGGRAVILPYVDGRSTTRLIEEVEGNAAG